MTHNLDKRILCGKRDGKFIQTERLVLLPLTESDAEEAFKWLGDPEVTKFMNYTVYTNVDAAEKWITASGHNSFGFFLRQNGRLIGCGTVHANKNGLYELGYNLAKAYWGNGYATEACKAMIAHRVMQGISDFYCEHAVDNVRSGGVIRKCGFVYLNDGSYTSFDGTRTFKSKKYCLHINRHEMNVDGKWFDKIVCGSKTIELRLNDEKRKAVKVGDYVILNNLDASAEFCKCVVKVTALHKYGDFADLYGNLDMTKCGYSVFDTPDPDDMLQYYSAERQAEWGVVGIEFVLIAVC